jgi:integrase
VSICRAFQRTATHARQRTSLRRTLLSDARVPIEVISRLVGHRSTAVTETVYRKQLRPVIEGGSDVMDRMFPGKKLPDA